VLFSKAKGNVIKKKRGKEKEEHLACVTPDFWDPEDHK